MGGLKGQHIVLIVGGGIAAYKAPDLVRRLAERGAEVRVVMTRGAEHFVTATTFHAISHHRVYHSLWDTETESGMAHLQLARWADIVLVAPATAHLIAELAHGFAGDLATTLALATDARLVLAPAMNRRMWRHPATGINVETLAARGARILGPATGELAERESGPGRMLEPVEIAQALDGAGPLAGKRVLVTAGPTEEPIDPVRFVGNRSSGRMGYAVANAALNAGAEVTLVSGPTALAPPSGAKLIPVRTAGEMAKAVDEHIADNELFISVAAVADYTPKQPAKDKIKKTGKTLTLELVRTPDILAEVAAAKKRPYCVGFAAETTDVVEHARAKLREKKLDLICANRVGDEHGFGREDNALVAISADGETDLGHGSKQVLAERLIALIAERLPHESG
ncbi:MAG: bifunctional phosphopantothenoylcysteine decarboxylase/phosphopantothenate--cysteine ligase CoaBC [Gammaproteobacteria bacterium]|nr:bifunctional phosphopantothenoylcysteine decarboxylase/phosphopantothenate--cysteine ligase CoaBC [Gammaproteobacteria bacterium]